MDTSNLSAKEKRELLSQLQFEEEQTKEKELDIAYERLKGRCFIGHFDLMFKVTGRNSYTITTEQVRFAGGNKFHGFNDFEVKEGTASVRDIYLDGLDAPISPAYTEISVGEYERMKREQKLDQRYKR